MQIYNVGTRIVNTYIYPINNAYVMIDTGYDGGYNRFLKRLEKIGIPLEKVKYLFLTHAHDDHAGFLNELLINAPWLTVIISDKSKPVLIRGQNSFEGGCSGLVSYFFCQILKVFGKGEHKFPKIEERFWDRFIEVSSYNKEKLESILNGKIIETPGHTSDSLSLLLDNGVLFCGDATMNGFPSIHNITIWIENLDEFSNSWRIICKTDAKKIYPSHGKPFDVTKLEENFKHLSNVKLFKL